ncbi:MAG TPA: RIP metalloprotease RseP [Longimicrobiales bacterium]|nr:RIP metalloprotease RseP [Longimicrobiales bacterium]
MTILATIIVLGVLIFVHELGHFAAAKAVGVEVQRFSIGLGPKVFGFQRGETEYVLSAIPLGGYVKMGGMGDEVMERVEGGPTQARREPSHRDFDAKPVWARTFVISAGVIMNMLFAFGLFTFVAARWGLAELDTTRVGRVVAELLPPGTEALAGVVPGAHIVSIGGKAVKDWGDVQEGLYDAPPGPLRIELADPAETVEVRIPADEEDRLNLVRAVDLWTDASVGGVSPGSPAAKAGFEAGDHIVAIEGVPVRDWYEFVREVEARPGQRVEVTLNREGHQLIRAVVLDVDRQERPDGSVTEVGKIGIYEPLGRFSYRPATMSQAVEAGYRQTVWVTGLILGFLRDLVTGNVSPRSMGSIVTIGEASGQAAAAGLDQFLSFMALFSVNLAVLNLLPIPVLDGGHLLFLGIEAVRGRSLSVEQRLRWSNVGFLVIMGIMLWALSNDFLRLFGL